MRILIVIVGIGLFSCSNTKPELKQGAWRGAIEMQGQILPFNLDIENSGGNINAFVRNGEEKLLLDEISIEGDSVIIVLHIFDIELHAKIERDYLNGWYIKNYDPTFKLLFTANYGEDFRFEKVKEEPSKDFRGTYAVKFLHEKDTTLAVGIFTQSGNHAFGTFLTPTGDYRYLEGNVIDEKLWLSTFDGNHAFLFSASKNTDGTLSGDYWSGKSWHETWTGNPDINAKIPDAESLTWLKEGYDRIDFTFPDVYGNPVTPGADQFKNKVLILQIFGTWCPNCMDETKFLAGWYKENKDRGVEILGLAYERKDDFAYASGRVKKMKEKLGVDYGFVIAGTNNKALASETLPMLNKVLAFPTTIFIGKDGKVKHIRTGFEGPGTGVYYDQFKQRFNEIVNELLSEGLASKK